MDYKVYEDSIQELACMVDLGDRDVVVSYSKAGFKGVPFGDGRVMSELNHETADQIRKLYPWAAPSRVLERDKTMGVGDRLGIADGTSRFRDRLYKVWRENREEYYQLLDSHIGHHVSAILGKL